MTKIFPALAPIVVAATLVATPTLARNGSWRVGNDQYHVYYSDLDMNSATGRAAMLARVEKAAARLCGNLVAVDRRTCVADTIARAGAMPSSHTLRLALAERDAIGVASR